MVQYVETFAALGDGRRLAVVDRLGSAGPMAATALAEPLGITVTGLLKHVAVLEAAGLVSSEKVGRTRLCRLNPEPLDAAATWLSDRERRWANRLDRFDQYLRQQQGPPQ